MSNLENAYNQYRARNFILQKAKKYAKFTTVKGSYKDRENEPFSPSATGYVAIIPDNIIIVDNDSYRDDNQFDKLLKDLKLDYTPKPFALTPSGGEHYAFVNPYHDLVIGNHGYIGVDIYAGYQSVIPIVGTTVKNKQGELASYEWADLNAEFIVNTFNENMKEVFCMRERASAIENDYDEMGLSLAIKEQDMPDEEVEKLCEQIPIETYGWDDGYLRFGMALYDRYEGNEKGLELFQKTCERYFDNDEALNERKWRNGHFKPDKVTYKALRSLATEGTVIAIEQAINKATSPEELEEAVKDVANSKLYTTHKKDEDVRVELLDKVVSKSKELTGKPEKVKWKKSLQYIAPEKELEIPDGFEVYRLNGKYLIRYKNKVLIDISSTMLKEQLSSLGIFFGKEDFAKFKNTIQTISTYKQIPDYTINNHTKFEVEEVGGLSFPAFVARINPLFEIADTNDLDEVVLDDFFNNIWAGKLYDIVNLIALTIKFKQLKLNRLMVIAPSNAGKSEIFTMLNFQKITMNRLINGMTGDKGIGSGVIEGIKKTGLLLIDEANKALPNEIKDMDKELHIDQFGSGGGTQIIPLHFTALTSTHSNATRSSSDELRNRFLQVKLDKSEMKYTIMDSPIYKANSDKYTETIRKGLIRMFKQVIQSEATVEELSQLQTKYRLPFNNDLEDLLYEIGEDFITETKSLASDEGELILKAGKYYCKSKRNTELYFKNRLNEIEALDVGKYTELLSNHFIKDRKSLKIDKKVSNYYELNLSPYTEDKELLIISEFDDLEEDEF